MDASFIRERVAVPIVVLVSTSLVIGGLVPVLLSYKASWVAFAVLFPLLAFVCAKPLLGIHVLLIVAPFSDYFSSLDPSFLGSFAIGVFIRDSIFLATVVGWILRGVQRGGFHIRLDSLPVLILTYVVLIACFIPIAPSPMAALLAFRNMGLYCVLALVGFCLIESKSDVRNIVRVAVFVGLITSFVGIIEVATDGRLLDWIGHDIRYHSTGSGWWEESRLAGTIWRATGLLDNSIVFGTYVVLVFLLLLSQFLSSHRKIRKAWLAAVLLLLLVAILLSVSRTAWLGLVVALFSAGILTRAYHITAIGTILVVVAMVLLFLLPLNVVSKTVLRQDDVTRRGDSLRLDRAARLVDTIREHPFYGTGLGTQGSAADRYETGVDKYVNDFYFGQVVAEVGIIGFLLYLFLLLLLVRRGAQLSRLVDDQYLRAFAVVVTSFIIALLFINVASSAFDSRVISIYFWTCVSALLALGKIERQPGSKFTVAT